MTNAMEMQLASIDRLLGSSGLVYFGVRGTDATSLGPVRQLKAVASLIAPASDIDDIAEVTLETFSGLRVDLDRYSLDFDHTKPRELFRRSLVGEVGNNTHVVAYSPGRFLDEALGHIPGVKLLGTATSLRTHLDNKKIVESEMDRVGIRRIPQEYVMTANRDRMLAAVADAPRVLRPVIGSGGEGMVLVRNSDDVAAFLTDCPEREIAMSPYIGEALPLNIGAVVWDNGDVTVHPASFQLIGIPGCTDKVFGYCGNDFGAAKTLSLDTMKQIEATTRSIGACLHKVGYLGAFGVDYLMVGSYAYFTEVNPRLQGSSDVSARLVEQNNEPGIVLEHLAAALGDQPACNPRLPERMESIASKAQLLVHSTTERASAGWHSRLPAGATLGLAPPRNLRVETGAISGRLTFDRSITTTGREVDPSTMPDLGVDLA